MNKRAAIYIRVSTEKQAEKVSPQQQEKDCRAHCEAKGYAVTEVYKDIERYRSGRRMVEPSGTRADRPQLRRMLADADAGEFDLIIAWREDRLYRGLRPMLQVIECIERNKLDIELVKETFDKRMAPLKASIAKMELEAIRERNAMGRAGRLSAGKGHPGYVAYGYKMIEKRLEVEPVEAGWVQKIYRWYTEGVPVREIRRRLIAEDAPQRKATTYNHGALKVQWAAGVIQKILTNDTYHTGRAVIHNDGQRYEIPAPILIDANLIQQAKERRQKNKSHPAHNVKHNYLAHGLAYCSKCKIKVTAKSRVRNGKVSTFYYCTYHDAGYVKGAESGCARTTSARKFDRLVWEKVWAVIADDEYFEQRVQAKIAELLAQEADAEGAVERLQTLLDDLAIERQKIITWARKGSISEEDMESNLLALDIERAGYEKEFREKSLLIGNRAQKLMGFANHYRAKLRAGAEFLNREPQTTEDAQKQFEWRREIVEAIVARIDILPDKTPKVYFEFDLSASPADGGSQVNSQLREFIGGSILENFKLWQTPPA